MRPARRGWTPAHSSAVRTSCSQLLSPRLSDLPFTPVSALSATQRFRVPTLPCTSLLIHDCSFLYGVHGQAAPRTEALLSTARPYGPFVRLMPAGLH